MDDVSMKVAALVAAQRLSLRKAAPFLASRGWPVFPCVVGGKIPLNAHGLLEASTDATVVARWWSRWPGANIGVATGARSGFDVIDVDVRGTKSGYRAFHQATERFGLENWLLRVQTPSGGMHFYYPADPMRVQRNWVCAEAAIDFRGACGSIILPPSWGWCGHDLDLPYTLIATRDSGKPINAVGLHNFLDPVMERRRLAAILRRPNPTIAVSDRLAAWVAARVEGERNCSLFWAACRMVEAGHPIDLTMSVLIPAAEKCGLVEAETVATVNSAYRHTAPTPTLARTPMTTSLASAPLATRSTVAGVGR